MNSVILLVLDGWGERATQKDNAIRLAQTPTWDYIQKNNPHTLLEASGRAVGLPEGQIGNSEVGHTTLGAGRILYQDLVRISNDITSKELAKNHELLLTLDVVKKKNATLHLMGLTSNGGVHSTLEHGLALAKIAKDYGISKIVWHAFLDGRDTPPKSAIPFLQQVEAFFQKEGVGKIGSMIGRFFAMDRDQRWERTEQAYCLLTQGQGKMISDGQLPSQVIQQSYLEGETDEFLHPVFFQAPHEPPATIQDQDAVIFFNFRADRARQITQALTAASFTNFERKAIPSLSRFLCMTKYSNQDLLPVLFPPQSVHHHLGAYLSTLELSQFRTAETEKYDHVTFFFHCGEQKAYPKEDRVLIPSRRDITTFNQFPPMSAYEITKVLTRAIESQQYHFLLANFANPDMLGHTGDLPAAIQAIEVIDTCLQQITESAKQVGASLVITADHGNCEIMWDETTNQPHTAHTTSLVPFVIISPKHPSIRLKKQGGLKDVAPTILQLMNLPIPQEMTGTSLIESF